MVAREAIAWGQAHFMRDSLNEGGTLFNTFAQADVRLYSLMMKSLCLLMVFSAACTLHAADAKPSAGLAVRYSVAGQADLTTAPNVALYEIGRASCRERVSVLV